jgi:DNA-binding transcriptional ArsR family regulator
MHAERDPPIKSTATSLDIVETVHALGGATLPEVVEQFDKPRSTVHDHLKTLTESGYLVKDGRTYRVSVRFLNLGGRARAETDLFQVAESELTQLADDTGEPATLEGTTVLRDEDGSMQEERLTQGDLVRLHLVLEDPRPLRDAFSLVLHHPDKATLEIRLEAPNHAEDGQVRLQVQRSW